MGITVDLFPLMTHEGDASDTRYQDINETIDTSRYSSAVVEGTVIGAANVTNVLVEGSDDGQDFSTVLTLSGTAPDDGVAYLNRTQQPSSPTTRLWRYLRWAIDPSATDWHVCGRITVTLK
jgi:hypothetical protein